MASSHCGPKFGLRIGGPSAGWRQVLPTSPELATHSCPSLSMSKGPAETWSQSQRLAGLWPWAGRVLRRRPSKADGCVSRDPGVASAVQRGHAPQPPGRSHSISFPVALGPARSPRERMAGLDSRAGRPAGGVCSCSLSPSCACSPLAAEHVTCLSDVSPTRG